MIVAMVAWRERGPSLVRRDQSLRGPAVEARHVAVVQGAPAVQGRAPPMGGVASDNIPDGRRLPKASGRRTQPYVAGWRPRAPGRRTKQAPGGGTDPVSRPSRDRIMRDWFAVFVLDALERIIKSSCSGDTRGD